MSLKLIGDKGYEMADPLDKQGRAKRHHLAATILLVILMVGQLAASAQAYQRPGRTFRLLAWDGHEPAAPVTSLAGGSNPTSDITPNGRYLAFSSKSPNLVPGDTNLVDDVFVSDLDKGKIERVSINSAGVEAIGACADPARVREDPTDVFDVGSGSPLISSNGRLVLFLSCATNLDDDSGPLVREAFVHDRRTGRTELVSIAHDGNPIDVSVTKDEVSLSADGRYVAFASAASNLIEDDTNDASDIFVFDRKSKRTERVSVSSEGEESVVDQSEDVMARGGSFSPCMSAEGRYVAFGASAMNLVNDDLNGAIDVFVHDRRKRTTEIVSVRSDGGASTFSIWGSTPYGGRCISADGRYVTFLSAAQNLIPNDSGHSEVRLFEHADVFVKDRTSGRVERVSVTSAGRQGNYESKPASISISGDGRYVTFPSDATMFQDDTGTGGGGNPGDTDVFAYDRLTGELIWLSVSPEGKQGQHSAENVNGNSNWVTRVVKDGSRVAFTSLNDNLVTTKDTNSYWDFFVRNIGYPLGSSLATASDVSGSQVSSGWNFASATDATADAVTKSTGADLVGVRMAYRPRLADISFRIQLDSLALVPGTTLYGIRMAVDDGTYYELRVQASPDRLGIFRLLFCADDGASCRQVSVLEGGFGTTGEELFVAVPAEDIAQAVEQAPRIDVYSALGTIADGPVEILDRISFGKA